MAVRVHYGSSDEVGLLSNLTNSYCLVPTDGSEDFYGLFEKELNGLIPIIRTTVAGSRFIGNSTVGNRNGLLVPEATSVQEMKHLQSFIPGSVRIARVDENLGALGSLIVCNDHYALVHPALSQATEAVIRDVLRVTVIRRAIVDNMNVGSFCLLSNKGGIVHPQSSSKEKEELTSLLGISIFGTSLNGGSTSVGRFAVVNDSALFCTGNTTTEELNVIESAFKFDKRLMCKLLTSSGKTIYKVRTNFPTNFSQN